MQEILRLAPTLLLIAGYVWFTRRQMGGLSGTAGGGRGLFNVGKAQVCRLPGICLLTGCSEACTSVQMSLLTGNHGTLFEL